MGYVALRAAPLGAIGPEPVSASFFGFHPSLITRALPDAWAFAAPEQALRAREEGSVAALRRLWGDATADSAEVRRAADLAWAAAAAVDVPGRVLAAANTALPRPADPLAALWQACTTLREHRGDGHVAVLVAGGVGPVAGHLLKTAAGETDPDAVRAARRWPDAAWDEAADHLRAIGWLDGAGTLTAEGAAGRASIEDATDAAAARPWDVLGADATEELARLLTPLADAVVASGTLPPGNPVGLVPR